jgi:class 3 adenylate cyclase
MPDFTQRPRLAAIMFTDVVGHSGSAQRSEVLELLDVRARLV